MEQKRKEEMLMQRMPKLLLSDFRDIYATRLMNKVAARKLRGRGIYSFADLFNSNLRSKDLKKIQGFSELQLGLIAAVARRANFTDWE